MSIIESDDYREEVATLREDPIIQEMAAELPDNWRVFALNEGTDQARHAFMMNALDEYKERGGTQARSIGGPVRAIIAILKEKEEA